MRYGQKEHKTTEKPQRLQGSEWPRKRGFRYGGERHSTGWNLRALPSFPEGLPGRYGGYPGVCAEGGIGGQTRDRNRRVPFPASGSGAILAGGFGKGSPGSIPVPTITTMPITTPFDLVPVFQVFQVILSPMAFGRPPSLERASGTQLTHGR